MQQMRAASESLTKKRKLFDPTVTFHLKQFLITYAIVPTDKNTNRIIKIIKHFRAYLQEISRRRSQHL